MIKMTFRFIELISWSNRPTCLRNSDIATRRHPSPQQVESGFNSVAQSSVPIQRPNQNCAEDRLPKCVGHLFRGKVIADLPLLLAESDQLGVQSLDARVQAKHALAHGSRRKKGLKKCPHNLGIACGFLGHANSQTAQELWHWRVGAARLLDRGLQFAQLHFAKSDQDVILAGEVVEKSAFTDVGRFRNVFDGRLRKALLAKQGKCCAKQAFASLGASTLTPIRSGC